MITFANLDKRLLADDELGFPLPRRLAAALAIERIATHIAKEENLDKFKDGFITDELAEMIIRHLEVAIEAIESELNNPTPHLKLVPPPKAKRRSRNAGGGK